MEVETDPATHDRVTRHAIIMPSVGSRPWLPKSSETFRQFAARYGLEFIVDTAWPDVRELPLPILPDTPGRKHKLAYAAKAYFVWKYLGLGFDRIAIVDDTCVVRPGAPNLFELVPRGSVGYTRTSRAHARGSFEAIDRFTQEHGLEPVDFDETLYMNSGVMVYDQTMREAFSPDAIVSARELLFAQFPHQTLCYYLLRRGGIPQFELPKSLNAMPALEIGPQVRKNLRDVRPYIRPDVFIYHLSGFYLNRDLLLEQLSDTFLEEWKSSSEG